MIVHDCPLRQHLIFGIWNIVRLDGSSADQRVKRIAKLDRKAVPSCSLLQNQNRPILVLPNRNNEPIHPMLALQNRNRPVNHLTCTQAATHRNFVISSIFDIYLPYRPWLNCLGGYVFDSRSSTYLFPPSACLPSIASLPEFKFTGSVSGRFDTPSAAHMCSRLALHWQRPGLIASSEKLPTSSLVPPLCPTADYDGVAGRPARFRPASALGVEKLPSRPLASRLLRTVVLYPRTLGTRPRSLYTAQRVRP
jgi:hypothetical protein